MSLKITTALIVLGFMLAGCGRGADQDTPAEPEDRDEVVDPMAESIDKAEAVEGQAMQHKEGIDEAVEDAEEPPEEPPADE